MVQKVNRTEYWQRRAAFEAAAADRAASDRAADLHRTLSTMYRVLADGPASVAQTANPPG